MIIEVIIKDNRTISTTKENNSLEIDRNNYKEENFEITVTVFQKIFI
jgi:hypothetical protein